MERAFQTSLFLFLSISKVLSDDYSNLFCFDLRRENVTKITFLYSIRHKSISNVLGFAPFWFRLIWQITKDGTVGQHLFENTSMTDLDGILEEMFCKYTWIISISYDKPPDNNMTDSKV